MFCSLIDTLIVWEYFLCSNLQNEFFIALVIFNFYTNERYYDRCFDCCMHDIYYRVCLGKWFMHRKMWWLFDNIFYILFFQKWLHADTYVGQLMMFFYSVVNVTDFYVNRFCGSNEHPWKIATCFRLAYKAAWPKPESRFFMWQKY